MKAGTVALIGRPNVGKSTLVNNLIGQKVAITSPKPQTTRFPIQGLYEDERGQIVFVDTPGIFRKATDALSKKINQKVMEPFEGNIDLVLYVIDHTRTRDYEESRVLGIVRKFNIPKILVINKIDVEEPSFLPLYKFLEDEFDTVIKVSALEKMHLKTLLEAIFEKMPETDTPLVKKEEYTYPALNIDGKIFLAELIREKVFLRTRKEVPYTTTVLIDEVADRDNGMLYVRARILTTTDKYKKMLIGEGGRRIKEIGSMSRKELETATNRKVFLDLTVESDKHWITNFS
jgi:GTP-binding protein Era